jgi:hypothetical protein
MGGGRRSRGAARKGTTVKLQVWLSVALTTVAGLACGGGSDDDAPSADPDAPALCEDYVNAACDYWAGCGLIDADERAICPDTLAETQDYTCDDAVSVNKNYDKCLDALEPKSCPSALSLPTVCRDVINIEI